MMQQKFSNPLALITVLLLVLSFIASYQSLQVPEVIGEVNSANQFSASKALLRLDKILPKNAHPVNSVANTIFRENIINQLEALGLPTEVQTTLSCDNSRRSLNCATVSNIIAQIPGTDSSTTVLLTAHYDSVPAGQGAADDGQGVAIILELLNMLKQQAAFKNDLIVLINEGEEVGLLGAKAFMEQHPLAKTVDVVINLEARGNQGKSLLFETGEDNYRLMKLYQQYAIEPLSNSLSYEIYKLLPNDTDLTVFKRQGVTGVNFAFQGRVTHYHTPLDNLANLSAGSVQHQGDNAYAMLQPLLSVDLKSLPPGNAVYTDIISSFMIVWPQYMTIPLTFMASFLLLLIVWQLLKSGKITQRQLATALPFAVAVVILSVISSWALLFIVQFVSGQSQPWLTQPIPMRVAIWLFPFSVAFYFANKYKDKLGFWGLTIAAALLLLILSIAASLYMPGASYISLLPLMVFSILMSISIILGQLNKPRLIAAIVLLTALLMSLLVFPMMLLLEDAMGFSIAPVFGLFESLVILLALPLIIYASQSSLKYLTTSMKVLSLLGLIVCTQQNAFSSRQPQHLNFEYLQQETSTTIQALTRHPLPQKMIAESAFSNDQKISRPWSLAEYPSINIESLGLAEPELDVLSQSQTGDQHQLTLRFSSARNSSQFLIYANADRLKQVSFGTTDQRSFTVPTASDQQYFLCTGMDCNGLTFRLTFTGNQPLTLGLIDYSFGLPESYQYLNQTRGDRAQQLQSGDVTLVHRMIEISK